MKRRLRVPADASDADAAVAKAQIGIEECSLSDWGTLEAGGDFSLLRTAAAIALNIGVSEDRLR